MRRMGMKTGSGMGQGAMGSAVTDRRYRGRRSQEICWTVLLRGDRCGRERKVVRINSDKLAFYFFMRTVFNQRVRSAACVPTPSPGPWTEVTSTPGVPGRKGQKAIPVFSGMFRDSSVARLVLGRVEHKWTRSI